MYFNLTPPFPSFLILSCTPPLLPHLPLPPSFYFWGERGTTFYGKKCEVLRIKKDLHTQYNKIYSYMFVHIQREFLKTRFSRCMLYRHIAAICTDWNLVFWDNSLYISFFLSKFVYILYLSVYLYVLTYLYFPNTM